MLQPTQFQILLESVQQLYLCNMDRRLLFAYVASGAVLFTFFASDYGRGSGIDLGRRLTETFHQHKDLLPMDASDFWGTLTVTLGLLVAAAGGIGGGGILVPLLILIFGFSPKYAVPLSNFTILGSSITNMVLNIPKRHPDCDRPLVDWDLILVMEPLTMAGAVSCIMFAHSNHNTHNPFECMLISFYY